MKKRERQGYILVFLKAQLGEPFLEILIVFLLFFIFFSANRRLGAPNWLLKKKNR